ncbi:MAG: tRNA (adenosine(37)-N6)-threonylcarbamoyltransferase complex ATPase subunit type 1 TsaE [Ktedonobacteraceae bacterium]
MREGSIVTRHFQEAAINTLDIISHSSAQTQRLGMRLGELVRGGELLLLEGSLGTGKTTFTQGLARGIGITEVISSPTFTLLKEYPGQPGSTAQREQAQATLQHRQQERHQVGPALYHFDLYRLDDPEEILDLGFEDYFFGNGVCVVEWADKAELLWPAEHLRLRMKIMSETKRGLLFTATGLRYCELLQQFQKNTYATTSS